MPRMARLVVPGYPHHITQRGNRRQQTFFGDADYLAYIELLAEQKRKSDVEIWAYCLMPNHVHMVAVPQRPQGLAKLLGVVHHRYARHVNGMHDWLGHLWQERFHSFVMDDAHLVAAVRYIELNPVRAGLCTRAEDWRWSSTRTYLYNTPDLLVNKTPMRERISDWPSYLAEAVSPHIENKLRQHARTGRPAGSEAFVKELEAISGRRLRARKPGPRRKS